MQTWRRDALALFGLREDKLLPDLHLTGAGVPRIQLDAHHEHRANQEARATDQTKVPAGVVQVAAHEMDADSNEAESGEATSGL